MLGKCCCPVSLPCSFSLCLTIITVVVALSRGPSFQVFKVSVYVVVCRFPLFIRCTVSSQWLALDFFVKLKN